MRAAGPTQIHALLPTGADPGIEATNHGQDRRPRLGGSLQRQPPHGGLTDHRRDPDQSWAARVPVHLLQLRGPPTGPGDDDRLVWEVTLPRQYTR